MLSGALAAGADQGGTCAEAASIGRDAILVGELDSAGDRDYFRLHIENGGMLDLRLRPLGVFEPRLQFLGRDCGGWSAAEIFYVERSDSHHVVHVLRPGDYFFRVLGDADTGDASYEITTGFVADPVGIDQHLTPVGPLPGRCGPDLLELGLSSEGSRQLRLTRESEPEGGEVVVVSTPEPGRVMLHASGVPMLGSLYDGSEPSCSTGSQIAADMLLNGTDKLVLTLEAGSYFLRLSPQLEAVGAFDLTAAFYPLP